MFSIFNIVRNRAIYFLISTLIIVPGIGFMIYNTATLPTHTPWKLSVDFRPGSLFVLKFTQPATEDKIRGVFEQFGLNNPQISRLGSETDNSWQVRTDFVQGDQTEVLRTALGQQVAPLDPSQSSVESVSQKVASEVTNAAVFAVIGATIGILLFIWWSFRKAPHAIRYSVCAIAAMIHDVLVAGGITAIFSTVFNWEIDALFLTAMLTVIGFSVQDTIVVYDRIRENLVRHRGESFEQIVSRSIVETLHRSLTISLTNILVMVALLLFGGASIKQFVAVLLIGLVSGTYSSIFNAVPLVVAWEERSLFGRRVSTPDAVPAK
jgi:preprotein translocase SecF subunit